VAHSVLVPLEAHESSVSGLEGLMGYIEKIQSTVNPDLVFLGGFINKWHKIDKSQIEVIKALKKKLGAKLFSTVVGLSTHIAQGYATRTPAVHAYPDTLGAKYVRDLARSLSAPLGLEKQP
jgi:cellulose biosynthesis protein BcsQ